MSNKYIGPFKTAEAALDELRRSVAEIIEEDPNTWPEHKNAPLAIAAVVGFHTVEIKHLTAEIERLRNELGALKKQSHLAEVPEGWKLVPIDIDPLERTDCEGVIHLLACPPSAKEFEDEYDYYADWWKRLLAAVPEVKR